jgi:type VI secretion system secreted protein VgrG
VAGDLGGQTLPPGLYKSTSSLGITGVLTLDGQGNANSVFIFQVASALTTATSSQVVLIGGAQAANIFWQVGSSATLGTYSIFNGTILAQASITLATGAALNGRALARTGAVTLDTNLAANPGPPFTGGAPPALAVACPLNVAQIGVFYSSLLVATGGTPPYSFSITGALPPNLILNGLTGAVTGTPTGPINLDVFTANATDSVPNTASQSCSITITAANQADVSIIKSGPATVAPNTNITYNLTVANAGPNPAASVIVTDVLPAGTTFVSSTPSQGSCSGTSTVICSLGTMAASGSATVVLVVLSPSSFGPVVNTAFVSSATPDPNIANNSSTWTVTVTPSVPMLSTWGLGVLALLLAGCSARFSRKAHV